MDYYTQSLRLHEKNRGKIRIVSKITLKSREDVEELFAFIDAWKNLLWPLLATRSMSMRVVEVGIASFHGTYEVNWPYQMAAGVTAVLPIVVLFLFTQRYFVQGIQMEGFR